MNEITDSKSDKWITLYKETIAAIRALNPTRLIMVGSAQWNSVDKLCDLEILDDPNVVYTFHFYTPFEFTHQRGVLQGMQHYYNREMPYPSDVEPYRDFGRTVWGSANAYEGYERIDKVLKMLPIMRGLGIHTVCFNWMAHIGWLRTTSNIPERGGAQVTGFDMQDFKPVPQRISETELWDNYTYFLKAVIPQAEKYEIRLALHPDDPPVPKLGDVSRIMISAKNIKKAIYDICPSAMLGITMCQANYYIMGEDVDRVIRDMADKIFFIHFRNTAGNLTQFRETFHDNGALDMAHLIRLYTELGIDVPIRVDHVPTLVGEDTAVAGYAALGRLFAIGYLKGLLEAVQA